MPARCPGVILLMSQCDNANACFLHMQDYFDSMPWLAVPWKDDQLRSVLSRKFNVSLIAVGGILKAACCASVQVCPATTAGSTCKPGTGNWMTHVLMLVVDFAAQVPSQLFTLIVPPQVQSIPRLVILGSEGEVVAEDARSAVSADPNGEKYPWTGSQPAK